MTGSGTALLRESVVDVWLPKPFPQSFFKQILSAEGISRAPSILRPSIFFEAHIRGIGGSVGGPGRSVRKAGFALQLGP